MTTEAIHNTPVTIDSQLQFNQRVTAHDFLVISFSAKWCEPCQPFAAVFAEVAAQHPQVLFATVDIDVAKDLATNFRVTQVPALMVVRDRVVIDMVSGAMHAHELTHHVQMWQAFDMTAFSAHFDQKSAT
ncbi:MAG: thioredoxin family protein [Methylophilus sp.]|uniref:thioredoxin family protein n=1 Tax=Methylophilus sp. TaxID=29541 RepID=UPI003F9F1DCC